jgi:hypothetical protein
VRLFQEYHDTTMPEVERRPGTLRARGADRQPFHLPERDPRAPACLARGPLKTEFWHLAVLDRDMLEDLKRVIRIGSQADNGAAGMFEQDDVDNWRQVTAASTSRFRRRHPRICRWGGARRPHPDYPGLVSERYISENNQRLFNRRWERFMNAGSWADIPLDPPRARFDGTATMR